MSVWLFAMSVGTLLSTFAACSETKEISEDDERRAADQVQKITDRFTGRIDEMGAAKEAEVMEV